MAKVMKLCALISVILTVLFTALFHTCSFPISLAITFGTISYHLCMRLLVGAIYDRLLHNHVDYNRKWFQIRKWEKRLYAFLHIKNWKASMPTYDKTLFDPKLHSWDEIAEAMCQAELVHETIATLSFLPIAAAVWFGDLPVFIITSILSACYDLMFVMMQRYNRPRVIKLVHRQAKSNLRSSDNYM